MTAPRIAYVVALDANRLIGRDNALPWRLPDDMRWFREQTLGKPCIMGRKTYDSLPERFRPLPGRRNIVVTRNPRWQPDGAEAAASLQAALAAVGHEPAAFVIGGGELYREALPRADELVLTEIDRDIDGDTFFPAWDRSQFEMLNRETHHAAPPNDFDFAFATYRRIAG